MINRFKVLSGTANPVLAHLVARELGSQLGKCVIERYTDGEVSVQIRESVRSKEVFLVQPPSPPADDHLNELLALADACRRAGAARIAAVVPFFGYGRSDKRHGRREPIMARMVADLLEAVGVDHVVTVDPHTAQIEGFFHVPVDSLTAVPTLCGARRGRLPARIVIVAPDAGRVAMANHYAQCLDAPVVVLHKRRIDGTQTEVTHMAGEVSGRPCLIVDDMISTGGTVTESIRALLEAGVQPELILAATHGQLVANAREKLSTDSVDVHEEKWPELRTVSIAPLLASALERLAADGPRGELHSKSLRQTAAHAKEKI
ncbi:ribose-phosphate pyrophosphokinase [Bradyrhizobium sp. WSM3983]|uniref:ribose-phosphate diphosphokinase n=1 Tax=Bradyrhizobium sp. WSM3983 TaxID=1038867 RepID=UPI000417BFE9|nr:ribose-phosphate pyrophosphokinase [Bradyrhizobium sp. WSM3983]